MRVYLSRNMPTYMEEFVDFAVEWLGIDKLRGELNIELKQTLESESFGLCWGDKREAEIHVATKQWGKPITRENKLKTLAHELTHAHQYLTGHLIPADEGVFQSRWLGEAVSYTPETDDQTPWEVQATACENRIYEAWMNR